MNKDIIQGQWNTLKGKIKENDVKKIQNFLKTSPDIISKLKSEYQRLQQ